MKNISTFNIQHYLKSEQKFLSKNISQTLVKTSCRMLIRINISKVNFKDNFIKNSKKSLSEMPMSILWNRKKFLNSSINNIHLKPEINVLLDDQGSIQNN